MDTMKRFGPNMNLSWHNMINQQELYQGWVGGLQYKPGPCQYDGMAICLHSTIKHIFGKLLITAASSISKTKLRD